MRNAREQRSHFPLSALQGLYAYLYCMMASSILADMPIFGGALFMCGQVATIFITTYASPMRSYLTIRARRWRTALLCLLLMMNLCLLVLYPIAFDSPKLWLLMMMVVLMIARDECTRYLLRLRHSSRLSEKQLILRTVLLQGVLLLVMTVTLWYNVGGLPAWEMLGGYALCSAMECYSLFKERENIRPIPPVDDEQARKTREHIRRANAYTTYETLATLIMAALIMTMVVLYTFLAVTAEDLLWCMVLSVGCMLIFREMAEASLRWREKRRMMDPTNLLLVGLVLWLYGLTLFNDMLKAAPATMTSVYIHLGLCSAGVTLCLTCLNRMEPAMLQVIRFAAGEEDPGYQDLRDSQQCLATLLGEMLALVALTVLCFMTGKDLPRDAAQIAARFQPVMVVPALVIVLAAGLAVLRFPLSSRWLEKLSRFLRLKESGGDNPALEKQLESVVVRRHRQPFGTRLLMALLRPFFRHELKGTENIRPDENNPIVFLCNHGEIYGPVVCMLYIPVPIRPWVMSELNIHKDEVAAYVYKHTISKITWLGPLRWPIAKLIGPVSVWCMNQLESIPVFRNKPRELMNTFRTSVEAMQAGDNLLIFPENPDADRDHPGYEHEKGSMGELFRGFAMLAQVYYNRTGKCCRFLPMYAHKGLRTLSFGTEIVYDPDNEPIRERDRIVESAYDQMTAMAQREDALYQQKYGKSPQE